MTEVMAAEIEKLIEPELQVFITPTGGYQLATDNGNGTGWRIHGPKFNGSSRPVLRHKMTERCCDELQQFIDHTRAALRALSHKGASND